MADEVEVAINLDSLNLKNRDIIDVERVTGMPFSELFRDGHEPTWLATQALGWVLARKNDPGLTWDDVLDMDADDERNPYNTFIDMVRPANPTPPAAKAGKRTASRK